MNTIQVEDTTRSYAGRIGCMCGCQGTYNESVRARKTAITQILKQDWAVNDFGRVDSEGVAGCLYVKSETRERVLYLTKQGLAKALAMEAETA